MSFLKLSLVAEVGDTRNPKTLTHPHQLKTTFGRNGTICSGKVLKFSVSVGRNRPEKAGNEFEGKTLECESPITRRINALERMCRRKLTEQLSCGSRKVAERTALSNRYKYVRRDAVDLDGVLASIRPEASVGYCNNVLKLLERRSEDEALVFFDWMRRNGKLDRNVGAYNLALRALSRNEDWKAAELLLDEMVSEYGCELNVQVFNTLVFVCAKRGMVGRGAKWFRMMLDRGVEPNVATFGMLMGLYQKAECLHEAEFTFDQMRQCNVRCVAAYSALITIYTRMSMYSKAEEVIRLMRGDTITPNLENWLVQLNVYCQQGKLEEAEFVFEAMQESGISENIVAYNTLITGYWKTGNMEAAQRLFLNLQAAGLEPDETTYCSMIEGYGRADNYELAKLYYKELKSSGFRPSPSNFYTMINLQARHDDENGSLGILADMREMGCEYSSILSILLQAYERIGRLDRVRLLLEGPVYESIFLDQTSCSILVLAYVRNSLFDDALHILQNKRWKDSTFEDNLYHTLICSCKEACNYEDAVMIFDQMPKLEENPNLHIISSMIDIYTRMNRFDEAESLYLKLQESGILLDMIAYSIVVRMYIKSGSLKDACTVLEEIEKKQDIIPDIYLYRDMLRVYQQCGMLQKLADVYYRMLKSNIKWDAATYDCVINCCGHAVPVDEISRLFDEMIESGYVANTITLNVMMDVYGRAGFFKKARKVLRIARKQSLADVISYNTLIAAYGRSKDFKNMRSIVQLMQDEGYPISLEAYNCLLDAYGKEDQIEEFNDVLQQMKKARCPSDHYTYNIMINIYGKKGWIEDVAVVFAELRKCNMVPDVYSYNSLIKAYGIAGMVEEAVNVVKEMRIEGLQPDRVTYVNLISALQRNESFLEAVKWSLWMKQTGFAG